MTALKIRDGIRRLSGSRRFVFQPETRSKPSSSLASSRGISAGIVLEVAVDRDDDLALRRLEAGLQRRGLAEVPPQPHDADAVVRGVQPGQRAERAVGGAVVDEDDLPGLAERVERRGQLVVEERDAPLLVVHGDDHRDHAR